MECRQCFNSYWCKVKWMSEKVKLAGGLEKTVTWIWLEEGQLNVEYYDLSESAQEMLGNDIAYTLTVANLDRLCFLAGAGVSSLIRWMTENFKGYFDIKVLLEQHDIAFHNQREDWA